MIYVPQFKAPTPAGSRDIDFDHFYDAVASSGPLYLPQLSRTTGDANPTLNIPLRIDTDAPFIWRGFKVESALRNFGIRLRDPFGNFLCPDADFVPAWLFAYPPRDASGLGLGPNCNVEPEVFCPANSVVYMDLFSWAATPWSDGGPDRVWLTGVKRFGQQSPCGEEVVCG